LHRQVPIVVLATATDLDALARWARGVWPVTIETSCRFQDGIGSVLRAWGDACRVDGSGLDKLKRLFLTTFGPESRAIAMAVVDDQNGAVCRLRCEVVQVVGEH
jgi:hypothetical protein